MVGGELKTHEWVDIDPLTSTSYIIPLQISTARTQVPQVLGHLDRLPAEAQHDQHHHQRSKRPSQIVEHSQSPCPLLADGAGQVQRDLIPTVGGYLDAGKGSVPSDPSLMMTMVAIVVVVVG